MGVSLETRITIAGVAQEWRARYGPDHHIYGDPYAGILTINRVGDPARPGDIAFISGLAGPVISHAERRQLSALVRKLGMNHAVFVRKRTRGEHRADRRLG